MTTLDKNDISTRRKRLSFRAWHRGTRELDLLIGRFADRVLPALDETGLDEFEAMLECGDPELYDWIAGRAAVPAAHDSGVVRSLLSLDGRCAE